VGHAELHQPTLERVRKSDKETVMAVPHFTAEYDESMAIHLSTEFTPDVATAVRKDKQLSRPFKQALITRAVAASRAILAPGPTERHDRDVDCSARV
jgi:hypothetical protein